MHRFGPTLFGSDWDATTEELAEWSRLARSAEQADIDDAARRPLRAIGDAQEGRPREGSRAAAAQGRLAIVGRCAAESPDATRHHQPARHRPLQVHDVAGDAASAPGDAGRVHASSAATSRAYPLAELLADVSRSSTTCARCASRPTSWPTWRAALHQVGLRRLPAHLPVPARLHRRPRGRRRARPRDRRQRAAGARDGVRDLRAGHRQRALLPPLRRDAALAGRARRLAAKVERLRAFAREPTRATPFEFFDFGVRRRFSGEWHREVVTTLQARGAAVLQGHVQRAAGARPRPGADRHDGARIPADLPGARRAAARLPARRARSLGAGIPRRPRHGADRRRRHGRLPGRLRPLLRQALRRPAPRLRRSGRLGREGAGALREAAHRRPHQAAGVLGRPGLREGARAVPAIRRPRADAASASAPTSPTTWG